MITQHRPRSAPRWSYWDDSLLCGIRERFANSHDQVDEIVITNALVFRETRNHVPCRGQDFASFG